MKLTAKQIHQVCNTFCNGHSIVDTIGNTLTLEDIVVETEGEGVSRTAILRDVNGNLYSCYEAFSYDDHGNRSQYLSSQSCNAYTEVYDGDVYSGKWDLEIKLTEVTRKEVIKVIYEVK